MGFFGGEGGDSLEYFLPGSVVEFFNWIDYF